MLRSVKNLADELGVEKFRIYKFIRDNDLRVTHLGSSKVMYFDDREAAKIIRAFTPETFEPEIEDMPVSRRTGADLRNVQYRNDDADLPEEDELPEPQVSEEQEAFRAGRMAIRGSEVFAAIIDDDEDDGSADGVGGADEQDPDEMICASDAGNDAVRLYAENESVAAEAAETGPADEASDPVIEAAVQESGTAPDDISADEDDEDYLYDMLTFIFDEGEDREAREDNVKAAPDETVSKTEDPAEAEIKSRLVEMISSQEELIVQLRSELQSRDDHITAMNSQLFNMTGALRNANDCIKRLSEGTRNLTESLKASQALYMSAVQSLSTEQEEKRRLEDRLSQVLRENERSCGQDPEAENKQRYKEQEPAKRRPEGTSSGASGESFGKRLLGFFTGRR